MGNFDLLVAKYIKANEGSADLSSIREQISNIKKNIQKEALGHNSSVFSFEENVNADEFTKYINSISNGTPLDNEAATLFAILDQDGDNKLDKEELKVFKRKNGQIDSFGVWSNINIHEENVKKINEAPKTAAPASTPNSSTPNSSTPNSSTPTTSNPTTSNPATSAPVTSNPATSAPVTSTPAVDDPAKKKTQKELMSIAEKIVKDGEDIKKYENILCKEDYDILQAMLESIKKRLGKDEDKKINKYAADLNSAINGLFVDKEELKSILSDDEISDEQFAKIIKEYEKKYGMDGNKKLSILTQINGSITAIGSKEEINQIIAKRLAKAAETENQDAIDIMCKELYHATSGIGTAEEFLETAIDEMSEKTLAKIIKRYREINKGKQLIDDIDSDYIYGDSRMLNKLKAAQRHFME